MDTSYISKRQQSTTEQNTMNLMYRHGTDTSIDEGERRHTP